MRGLLTLVLTLTLVTSGCLSAMPLPGEDRGVEDAEDATLMMDPGG